MRILVLNAGSATLKFALGDTTCADPVTGVSWVAGGDVSDVGGQARLHAQVAGGPDTDRPGTAAGQSPDTDRAVTAAGDRADVQAVLEWLEGAGLLAGVEAVGHRVVHGGPDLHAPTVVDGDVLAAVEAANELAPLHNRPALRCLRAATDLVAARVPHVAVFDTAFHAGLPACARTYAIPPALAERYRIRRYGFHGLAHRWMWERYLDLAGADPATARAVTLQLGSGCSAAAVRAGRCVDTSMGLTPLEGLVMRTRSGSVDPALVAFLARREDLSPTEVETLLNRDAGMAAVGGHGGHVGRLLEAEAAGDQRAALALELFCYSVSKQVGAYLAALGGADGIVFGGGIGEHAPQIRARALARLGWCGVELDEQANAAAGGTAARITAAGAPVGAWVVPVDEAAVIAADVHTALSGAR